MLVSLWCVDVYKRIAGGVMSCIFRGVHPAMRNLFDQGMQGADTAIPRRSGRACHLRPVGSGHRLEAPFVDRNDRFLLWLEQIKQKGRHTSFDERQIDTQYKGTL